MDPLHKAIEKMVRIYCAKDPAERVIRRDALGQFQKGLEPVLLGLTKDYHVLEAFVSRELRTQANHKNIDQFM